LLISLQENDILLNAIVFADYLLEEDYIDEDDDDEVVFGVDARGVSIILEPDGEFSETNETVVITAVC